MKRFASSLGVMLIVFFTAGCSKCNTYYTPVDHATEYMEMDVEKYPKIKFKDKDGEIFEAIVYEKCDK